MVLTTLALTAGLAFPSVPAEVRYFPGEYYATRGRQGVERTALDRWPGPTGLLKLWRGGNLSSEERVALLLGGGAFHDPQLLPAYREAVVSPDDRIRAAAAFGLHVLLADAVPTGSTVDEEASRRLERTVTDLQEALRRRSLTDLWIESLLRTEGTTFRSDPVLVFERPLRICLAALDTLLEPEDLPLVLEAYRRARTTQVKVGLVRLLEGLTATQMIVRPHGPRVGWGPEIYRNALARADRLAGRECDPDPARFLTRRLVGLGVRGVDPFSPDAGGVWLKVLEAAPPLWWPLATRLLYRNGGPPLLVPLSERETKQAKALHERVLRFYAVRGVGRRPQARSEEDRKPRD